MRPPNSTPASAQLERSGPDLGTRTAGSPGTAISPTATARRLRCAALVPGGKRASTTSIRNRARADRPRQQHVPAGADGQHGGDAARPSHAHPRGEAHVERRRPQAQARDGQGRGRAPADPGRAADDVIAHPRATTGRVEGARRAVARLVLVPARAVEADRGAKAGQAIQEGVRRGRRGRGPRVQTPAPGGRRIDQPSDRRLAVPAVARVLGRLGPGHRGAPEGRVPRRAGEHVGQRRPRQVLSVQGALGHDRRAQRLCDRHARDAHLGQPAGPARLVREVRPGDAETQRAHAVEVQGEAVPARMHAEVPTGDLEHVHDRALVVVGQDVDVVDVTRRVEPDLDPTLRRRQGPVGDPRRRRGAVDAGERPMLGEEREPRRFGRSHVPHAAVDGHRLRRAPAGGERVELGGVRRHGVGGGQRGPRVLGQSRGREDSSAVGVRDHDLGTFRGGGPDLRRSAVGGVEQRPVGGERAERGQPGERLGRAVDDGGGAGGLHAHHRARRMQVVTADLGECGRLAELARRRTEPANRSVGSVGAREALPVEHPRGVHGMDGAAAVEVVVGADDEGARPQQAEQRAQLAGIEALLLDEAVHGPEQVDGVQVGVRDDVAHGDRPLRQRGQDRVHRSAPAVEREQLAGHHNGTGVARERAVELAGGVRPRRGDRLPRDLVDRRRDRWSAATRPARAAPPRRRPAAAAPGGRARFVATPPRRPRPPARPGRARRAVRPCRWSAGTGRRRRGCR